MRHDHFLVHSPPAVAMTFMQDSTAGAEQDSNHGHAPTTTEVVGAA